MAKELTNEQILMLQLSDKDIEAGRLISQELLDKTDLNMLRNLENPRQSPINRLNADEIPNKFGMTVRLYFLLFTIAKIKLRAYLSPSCASFTISFTSKIGLS